MITAESQEEALHLFRGHQGMLRTSQALALGIHPRTLYALHDAGLVERLARGLYRLTELPPLTEPDLVTVALRIPDGVICLISALAFHDLTTQIPHAVDVAVEQGKRGPRLDYPPIRVFWFSGNAWREGFTNYTIDEIPIRVTIPAKTIADSFKYRRKLGQDIALEALERYHQHPDFDVGELLHYARICRVETVIKPYLEMLL
ncbi:MAG: type IV toxin-antitoxin system AbiEi family antitoxin domain-containing protein [Anaerolineae bacterium]|nr:type IV toxin-antitoxin system AbiEi family antitoxin domain-containing protein [Anaerolineae bacterium]